MKTEIEKEIKNEIIDCLACADLNINDEESKDLAREMTERIKNIIEKLCPQ